MTSRPTASGTSVAAIVWVCLRTSIRNFVLSAAMQAAAIRTNVYQLPSERAGRSTPNQIPQASAPGNTYKRERTEVWQTSCGTVAIAPVLQPLSTTARYSHVTNQASPKSSSPAGHQSKIVSIAVAPAKRAVCRIRIGRCCDRRPR